MSRPAEVRVTRRLSSTPERVFDAWIDAALIGQWMFGGRLREEEVLGIAVDPRVGGRFSFKVRRGGAEIDHVGAYLEIDRPKRLAFTWGIAGESDGESRVTVDFAADGAGCLLTLTHTLDAKWADYVDRVREGWTKMTGALDDALGGYGWIVEPDTLRFERLLPGPVERAWAYLTESDKRGAWFAAGPMDLRAGGAANLRFDHNALTPHTEAIPERHKDKAGGVEVTVYLTAVDAPRLLGWNDDPANPESGETFELLESDGKVVLRLTQRHVTDGAMRAEAAAAWHAHLDVLEAVLANRTPGPFWSALERLHGEYTARMARR